MGLNVKKNGPTRFFSKRANKPSQLVECKFVTTHEAPVCTFIEYPTMNTPRLRRGGG